MAAYQTRTISLKTKPFAESDKLVTLFTRDYGKITVIAKGSRKVPSRFGGRVEPLTYAECLIAKGRSLDILSQCQVLESFQRLRDAEVLPAGLYLLRLVDLGTVSGQKYPELFDLLLKYLLLLKDQGRGLGQGLGLGEARKLAKEFEKEFVRLEGIDEAGVHPALALSDHVGTDIRQW